MCKQKKQEKITRNIFFLSMLLFVFSMGFKLLLSGNITVRNLEMQEVIASKHELEKEVRNLKFIDAEYSKIGYIEQEARKLGFIDMEDNLLSIDTSGSSKVASL